MITKERLLAGLEELLYVEEGMITTLSAFDKALVDHTEDMDEDKRSKIKKLLSVLYNDSAKHKEKINDLTKQIGAIGRDEY